MFSSITDSERKYVDFAVECAEQQKVNRGLSGYSGIPESVVNRS